MTVKAIDISHYQGVPDFNEIRNAGVGLVIMKATDGLNGVDPRLVANREAARAAGLVKGFYHFARATNAVNEAAHFYNTVGQLEHGDVVALDWEVAGSDPVGWSLTFLQAVERRLGVKPLIYLNKSTVKGYNWDPVVHNDNGLWIASYDYNADTVPSLPHWSFVAIKQYSDKGTVHGINGAVDLDTFEGDLTQLEKYGYSGGSPVPAPPAPAPAPPAPPAPAPVSNRVQIGTYTVRAGDNLTDIAKRYPEADVTAATIAADNGITNPNYIKAGQVFRILSAHAPAPAPSVDPNSLPTMAYGENSPHAAALQKFLNDYDWRPALPLLPVTGYFGPSTAAILHAAGKQLGVQGDKDGKNFGPHFKAAFARIGFRG